MMPLSTHLFYHWAIVLRERGGLGDGRGGGGGIIARKKLRFFKLFFIGKGGLYCLLPPLQVQRWAGLFGSKCDLSMQISPLGGCLVSALTISIGENGTIPLLSLTLITITSMQLQTSKFPDYLTSTPPYNPQAQLLYTKCTRLNTTL